MKETSSRLAQQLYEIHRECSTKKRKPDGSFDGLKKVMYKKYGRVTYNKADIGFIYTLLEDLTTMKKHVQGNKRIGITGTDPLLYKILREEDVRRRGCRESLIPSPSIVSLCK